MDGGEDGIYWKSSFLSFHDMVTPICWLVNHYIDWGSVYYWDLTDQITKSNQILSDHKQANRLVKWGVTES